MSMKIKLSNRLQTIASFLSPGTYFADIGSDHGYLPCYVCLNDKLASAIGGEVREGPYLRAKETVIAYQLTERIDIRLGDGLQIIDEKDHVDEIVIAGMGGSLMTQIIADGKEKLQTVNRMILQPNNHSHLVRELLLKYHYQLVNEVILEENNHIYEILVADKNSMFNAYKSDVDMEKQLMFGPILMAEKSPVFLKKWKTEQEKISSIIQQMKKSNIIDDDKLGLFKQHLQWIEEVLS